MIYIKITKLIILILFCGKLFLFSDYSNASQNIKIIIKIDNSIITSQDINYENVIMSLDEQRLAWNRQFGNQILSLPRVAPPSFGNYALSAAADISSVYMANTAPSTNPTGTGRFDGAGSMESYQLNPTGYSGSR